MTVAFAALHMRLRYRGEETRQFALAFEDRTMFFSPHKPPLYDAAAKRIASREVLPGSYVNVRYHRERDINWIDAVQVVRLAEDQSPFDPVVDDGHL